MDLRNTQKEELKVRLEEKLRRELGSDIIAALYNKDIVEIMLNPDGKLWFDILGGGMIDSGHVISRPQAENLLGTIAAICGVVVNNHSPILEVELPFDGSRFTGIVPPIVSSPTFTIRKKPSVVFTLSDYLKHGIINSKQKKAIQRAVKYKQNILVIGGTGSGKTTLVNAILHELSLASPNDRLVLIEDTVELKSSLINTIEMRTSQDIDILKALRTSLRMRPCRIIIGEIRGFEANGLIKAWNTGHHGGISTIHANSASAGLTRLEQLIHEAGINPIREVIAETINMLIYIERINQAPYRQVKEIKIVEGYTNEKYQLKSI